MAKIHQALFGDKNGGYGLLKATCDAELAKKIANFTDVHEQTPDVVKWDNILRGFAIDKYYLLMRTFVDTSQNVRQGRVYSHCLIINLRDLHNLNNLNDLLKYLPKDFTKDSDLAELNISTGTQDGFFSTPRINYLIKALLESESDLFAWQDYAGYEESICAIWNNIAVGLRPSLRFGLAFSVQESMTLPGLKIFCVPGKLISKWEQNLIPIIAPDSNTELTSEAEKSLAGISSNLSDFVKEYGIQINKIEDYLPIQKILKTTREIDSTDLNGLLTLLNTLCTYVIKPEEASILLEEISKAIIIHIRNGSMAEVVRIRIENLKDFLPEKLFEVLRTEIEKRVVILATESVQNILDFYKNLINPNVQDWWRQTIIKALRISSEKSNEKFISAVFALTAKDNLANIDLVNELIPVSCEENKFTDQLNKGIKVVDYSTLEVLAKKRKWLNLLAMIFVKTKKIQQAVEAMTNVDPGYIQKSAYEIIIRAYPIKKIFETAEKIDSAIFTGMVVDLLLEDPKNIAQVDHRKSYDKQVLITAVVQGLDFFSYPKYKIFLYETLDDAISGKGFNYNFLAKISHDSKCQIIDYPQRNSIWQILPEEIKTGILHNTSGELLKQLSFNSTTEIPDDTILQQYISKTGISDFLYFNSDNIKSVIPIFEKLILQDSSMAEYITNYSGTINAIDSKKLGKLIYNKRYGSSAYAIKNKVSSDSQWKFALLECYHLLDVFTIGFLNLKGVLYSVEISAEDWWQAAEDLISELYSNAPSLTTIWKKSGGKEGDINMNSNPNNVWHDLIHKLRHNVFKDVTMDNLLNQIDKQYGHTDKFKSIYVLKEKFSKT